MKGHEEGRHTQTGACAQGWCLTRNKLYKIPFFLAAAFIFLSGSSGFIRFHVTKHIAAYAGSDVDRNHPESTGLVGDLLK